jgi:hypothetical protein
LERFIPALKHGAFSHVYRKNVVTIGLRGINLFDVDRKLYINKAVPYTHGKDTLMFKYTSKTRFIQIREFEVFRNHGRVIRIDDCFFHLKYCKKDRGLDNYNLNRNKTSRYVRMNKKIFENSDLIPLEKFDNKKQYPNPFDIGFYFINEGQKRYECNLFNNLEEKIREKYGSKNIENECLDSKSNEKTK